MDGGLVRRGLSKVAMLLRCFMACHVQMQVIRMDGVRMENGPCSCKFAVVLLNNTFILILYIYGFSL